MISSIVARISLTDAGATKMVSSPAMVPKIPRGRTASRWRATRLAEPVEVPRLPEYAGCKSWVQLPLAASLGEPVYDEASLRETIDRVRDAVE